MNASTTATSPRFSPSRRSALAAFAAACALPAAAAGAVEPNTSNLKDLPELRLAVAEVQVTMAYVPPRRAPFIEHTLPFPPHRALEAWAKSHVRPAGGRGTAAFVVVDASVKAVPVKAETAGGVRDWFRRQPVERYDGSVELRLDLKDDAGRVRAGVSARARHARFLMDDHKAPDRLQHLEALVDELMAAAVRELDKRIRRELPDWLR